MATCCRWTFDENEKRVRTAALALDAPLLGWGVETPAPTNTENVFFNKNGNRLVTSTTFNFMDKVYDQDVTPHYRPRTFTETHFLLLMYFFCINRL